MADQDHELNWRQQAIRLRLKGWRPCEIQKRIPRGREWLRKWWLRFSELGWNGLHDRSRRPTHRPQAYQQHAHTLVINLRRALEQRQIGLVGARAIQQQIRRQRLLQKVPSQSTIKRWLQAAQLSHALVAAPEQVYYPEPQRPPQEVWHACDWIARYLEGGAKVFVFHTVDLESRALCETIREDKTVASVRAPAFDLADAGAAAPAVSGQ